MLFLNNCECCKQICEKCCECINNDFDTFIPLVIIIPFIFIIFFAFFNALCDSKGK